MVDGYLRGARGSQNLARGLPTAHSLGKGDTWVPSVLNPSTQTETTNLVNTSQEDNQHRLEELTANLPVVYTSIERGLHQPPSGNFPPESLATLTRIRIQSLVPFVAQRAAVEHGADPTQVIVLQENAQDLIFSINQALSEIAMYTVTS